MPIAPPPSQLCCPQCQWSTVEHHRSDCLLSKPITHCPRCGHTELERTRLALSGLKPLLQKFENLITKIL
jgi:hypothetical protein